MNIYLNILWLGEISNIVSENTQKVSRINQLCSFYHNTEVNRTGKVLPVKKNAILFKLGGRVTCSPDICRCKMLFGNNCICLCFNFGLPLKISPSFCSICWEKEKCVCVFGFNVAFNNFSVISRRCLVATGSSMLTFIVLPHWSIMSQTLDPVTLSWHWVDQSKLYPLSLSAKRGAASTIFYDPGMSWPGIEPVTSCSPEQTLYQQKKVCLNRNNLCNSK